MSSIGSLASSLLQAVLPTGLFPANTTTVQSGPVSSLPRQPDTSEISSFAQVASALQQLQQSNPAQYQQVTQQIATNLQSAAQTAQSAGNARGAAQLNQLSTDFTNASAGGQLPNLHDLARAAGGHQGHLNRDHAYGSAVSDPASADNAAAIIQNTLITSGISI